MSMTTTSSASLVRQIKKGVNEQTDAVQVLRSFPQQATVLSKALRDSNDTGTKSGISDDKVQVATLYKLSERIGINKENTDNIVKLFPDIKLAIQILVSSIMSPKNMTDVYINYSLEKGTVSPGVMASVLDLCKYTLENEYKVLDNLPDMIEASLFTEGAYITAIIPESSVDQVINNPLLQRTMSSEGFESCVASLVRPRKLLNSTEKKPEYSDKIRRDLSDSVVVIDNFEVIKYPKLQDVARKLNTRRNLRNKLDGTPSASFENYDYMNVFKDVSAGRKFKPIEELATKNETVRQSIGKPMHIRLPMDSVIPVARPGDTSNHIAYFVLLDENGVPIDRFTMQKDVQGFDTAVNGINNYSPTSGSANVTHKAAKNLLDMTKDQNLDSLFQTYKEVLDKEIRTKIMNSLNGSNISAADRNEIYYVMFFRALQEQRTTLAYVPSELINYFSMDHHPSGVGKTLLHDMNVLFSLRSITMFSRIMAYSKQAIDVTKVNLSLDPNDPDPTKTIETLQNEVLRMRQGIFPLGVSNVHDIVEWIQRAGLQFEYENHPGIPDVKLDFSNNSMDHTVPNPDLEKELKDMTIMALGLTPEVVDAGFNPEFATTIVNNNILLSKRILLKQVKVEKNLKDLSDKIFCNDYNFRYKLKEILQKGINEIKEELSDEEVAFYERDQGEFFEYLTDKIIDNFTLTLPKPEATNLRTMSESYDEYSNALDKLLPSIISEESIPEEIAGSLSTNVDTLARMYKHYLLRMWAAENNFIPEAFDVINQSQEQENLFEINKVLREYLKSLTMSAGDMFRQFKDIKKASDKDLENLEVEEGSGEAFNAPDSDTDDAGDEGGEEDFSGLDLGGDLGGDIEEETDEDIPDEDQQTGEDDQPT